MTTRAAVKYYYSDLIVCSASRVSSGFPQLKIKSNLFAVIDFFAKMVDGQQAFLDFLKVTNCLCGICGNTEETYLEVYSMHYRKALDDGPSQEYTRVFDISNSRYCQSNYPSEQLYHAIKARDGPFSYVNYGNWNLRYHNAKAKLIYRRCPINYRTLSYLRIPCPKRAEGTRLGFVEHGIAEQITEDDFNESERYNRILEKNFKYAFFRNSVDIMVGTTGYWRNPFVRNPRTLPELTETWKFIETDATPLVEWARVLSMTSHRENEAFLSFLQASIRKYITETRLDDDTYWADEPGYQKMHLRNIIQLLTTTFNVCHNSLNVVWNHLSALQQDYAKLLTAVVTK